MKRAVILTAIVAVVLAAFSAHAGEGESAVHWTDMSWDQILKTAKQENKHVVIDFYATWCGPCKRMDKITYMDEDVAAFMNANIPVKYDAEKGTGEELAKKYRIVAYPTTLMIGPDGKEIDRHLGYLEADEFLGMMKGFTRGEGTVAWYEKQLEQNPDDIELHHTLGIKYADAVVADKAKLHLEKVLAQDPEDEHGWRGEIMYSLGDVSYRAEDYETARKYFQKLIDEYPDTDWHDEGLRRLARIDYALGDNDGAVANYKAYLDRHPDDPRAMNAFAWFCSQRGIGLDAALPVALKAAELSNRDPGILDTLAEVYYARGEYDKAIEVGKEALESDPDDQYFKDQVEKYKKAKQEADAQASR